MRRLNLDQLRALVHVVEHGSFSVAARLLNLTQPAVSLQIRQLEQRFGVRLIERLGKSVHATQPGRDLVAAAGDIFQACDQAEAAMRQFRDGWVGRVTVATTNTALTYRLPPVLRRLRREHPGIDLSVTNMATRESVEAVLDNKVDLALVSLPVAKRQLCVTPLWHEQLVAIFPADTRDLPDTVTPEFLAEQPLLLEHAKGAMHTLVLRWLSLRGRAPRTPIHLGTIEALKSAVASHLGVSVVPDSVVAGRQRGIIVRPLRPQLKRITALIERHNKPNERAQDIVRKALLELRDRPA